MTKFLIKHRFAYQQDMINFMFIIIELKKMNYLLTNKYLNHNTDSDKMYRYQDLSFTYQEYN